MRTVSSGFDWVCSCRGCRLQEVMVDSGPHTPPRTPLGAKAAASLGAHLASLQGWMQTNMRELRASLSQ